MKKSLLVLLLITLSACKPAGDKVVDVILGSILEPVSVTFSQPPELGELAVSIEPILITMEIKNNSSDAIRKLGLVIGPKQNLLKFTDNLDSMSFSPGYEGTCSDTLAPGSKCTYKLSFIPRKIGTYSIPVTFNYENLIEPQTKSFTFTSVVGEPAALAFTNDISNYDFGVIEQTEATQKFIDLEVQNIGGLSARNVTFTLENDNTNGAYEVIKNDCPTKIIGSMKCKIRIGYTPHNNNYTDAPITYSGKYSLEYLKDPSDNTGKLNSYFTFLSVTIEANFKQNFSTIEFPVLVAGNQDVKTVKISNGGYRAGIMKEMNFFDYQGNKITTCKKGTSGLLLDCQKDMVAFPFTVEDTNSCFEKSVAGIIGKASGESCYFKITYWPSTTYQTGSQASHSFNDSTISLFYDSQWKGNVNMVTKNSMFTVTAKFLAAGKLMLDKVEIENIPILNTDITAGINNVFEADLGRIALVSSPSYFSFIKVTFRNTGETPVTLNNIKDGAPTPNEIFDVGYDLNSYYKQIKYNSCMVIAPGATCNISFNLTPVVQSTSAITDALMYDNSSNPLKKYKRFISTYTDGSTIEDNGSPSTSRLLEVRLIAKLIRKGYLSIDTASFAFPAIVNGTSSIQNIFLKNVGTGDVYAVVKDNIKNLDPKSAQLNFPFRVLDLGTPILPATKDCYDILYPAGSTPATTMAATPDITKFLAPGESCVMGVENKLPDTTRNVEADYAATTDYTRPFSSGLNNTGEIWARKIFTQGAVTLNFKYYDGDNNPAVPASIPYGYQASTKDITVSSSFTTPANIIVRDPLPGTSALLDRPPLNYPAISATYPIPSSLGAKSVVESYFESSYFNPPANGFTKSKDAITHVKAMGITGGSYDSEYKFHGGTFPINQTTPIQFSFNNAGGRPASNATLTEEAKAAGYPIQIDSFNNLTVKPFPALSISAGQNVVLKFKFTPTIAGLYKRCYTLTYDSGLDTREQYVCVYAEAVASSPKIKIEYKDVTVTQSGSTVTESEVGSFVALNTPMNSVDITSIATFSAIRASIVYAKKRIKITNIGTLAATKFNYYYMDSTTNAATNLPADTSIMTTGLPFPCTLNLTLAAGAYCEFYIKYMPSISSSTGSNRYLGTIFDIGNGLNQYISYTGYMQFLALDPAKLAMNMSGVNSEVVTDWSNPVTPIPLNVSWPVNVGTYTTATTPPHLLLTNNPTTKTITNIEIKNSSTLKASFLSMNSAPVAGTWNPILANSDVTIWANRYCFYGDDENNGAVAAADKGFSSTSVNKCYLQVDFKGYKPYESCSAWNAVTKTKVMTFGQNIVANCNPYVYTLTYWNYKRAAQAQIYLHMKGFVEPNRVTTATPVLSNVSSVNTGGATGSVAFSWPSLSPQYAGWGAITKYRVYYDTNYNNLNSTNAFKLTSTIPYKETTNAAITSITVPSLIAGNYYYFKVFAVQTFTGVTPNLTYISNSNIPILTVPIPSTTQVYNHSLSILIDKTYKAAAGTRTNGVNVCAADYYNLNIGGSVKKAYKTLISTPVFNYLTTSASLSSGYPAEGIGAVPHWVSDGAYDLKTLLSLYNGTTIPGFPGYSPASMSGNNPSKLLIYQKACNNNVSCDQLFKIAGGDGIDLYYQGTFYATATGISAFYRCYGVILCPTDPTKLITNGTCAKP